MEIVILPDTAAIGSLAADAIGSLLARKPDAVLGLATGSSPLAIYDELTNRCADGAVTFARAKGFTLDECVGLPADHPESYPERDHQGRPPSGATIWGDRVFRLALPLRAAVRGILRRWPVTC